MSDLLQETLDRLAAGRACLSRHRAAYRLVMSLPAVPPLGLEVIAAFEKGVSAGEKDLAFRAWREVRGRPVEGQGALRILLMLLQPDAPLDSHGADYLIGWARSEGLSDEVIRQALST